MCEVPESGSCIAQEPGPILRQVILGTTNAFTSNVVVGTVASFAEHAYEMDTLELNRTSIMSAASALTTDRSMFPKDLMKELQDSSQTD
ncbi:MAG: hypothetical protein ACU0DE_03145 [Paracoccus sp. (in: a-proteobacteria)]|uniref:hypothetical protein n=1 Tax=Paracoccus sp. TaxID=267 RepID=UPI004059F77D